eukprot:592038-Amphidinium_carterae.1
MANKSTDLQSCQPCKQPRQQNCIKTRRIIKESGRYTHMKHAVCVAGVNAVALSARRLKPQWSHTQHLDIVELRSLESTCALLQIVSYVTCHFGHSLALFTMNCCRLNWRVTSGYRNRRHTAKADVLWNRLPA